MAIHINKSGGTATLSLPAAQEIVVTHADDSIKVGDGTDFLAVNADGSINAKVTVVGGTAPIDVNVAGGSVTFAGSANTIESGTVATAYAEVLAVGAGIETTVVSYAVTQPTRLKIAEVSGTNIAAYTIYVNATPIHKKRTYYGMLDNSFVFSKGYATDAGDTISVTVLHGQTNPGDFNAFLLVLKD